MRADRAALAKIPPGELDEAVIAGAVPNVAPQIQGGHRVQHDEDQIVPGQPLAHARRHQQRLITLRAKEILRHTP